MDNNNKFDDRNPYYEREYYTKPKRGNITLLGVAGLFVVLVLLAACG